MSKVCLIGPSKKFFSGLSAYTICLANALLRHNHVSVVLLRRLLPKFLYPGKAHVGREDYSLSFAPQIEAFDGMDWNSLLSWLRAYRFLKQQKPNVIIIQWWTSSVVHMQLFLAIVNRVKVKAKLILEMHEIVDPLEESILPIRLYSRIMGRLLMSKVDAFVVHSTAMKGQVTEIYHLSESRVFVIPLGLYDVYYRHIEKQAAMDELGIREKFVILYFGLIRKYKGIPYLVEAFNKLPQDITQNSRLVIAGEDWGDETSLVTLINSSPFKIQITYRAKFIPDDMVPKYFSAADVIVLPYLRTSGSGVANIAMAYGKPIITSDLETMRECLMNYAEALFVPVGDSEAIAEKLVEIRNLYTSGKGMVYKAPQNSFDEVASQYEQVMEQLTNSS